MNQKRKFYLAIEITVDKANIEQFRKNDGKLIDIEAIHRLNPETIHIVPAIWSNGCDRYTNEYLEELHE